jgi:hypothetical protein
MGIPISAFEAGDVYIDFPYEEVMFRYDSKTGKVFRRFYGDAVEKEVDLASNLYADATIAGTQITQLEYQRGRPRLAQS